MAEKPGGDKIWVVKLQGVQSNSRMYTDPSKGYYYYYYYLLNWVSIKALLLWDARRGKGKESGWLGRETDLGEDLRLFLQKMRFWNVGEVCQIRGPAILTPGVRRLGTAAMAALKRGGGGGGARQWRKRTADRRGGPKPMLYQTDNWVSGIPHNLPPLGCCCFNVVVCHQIVLLEWRCRTCAFGLHDASCETLVAEGRRSLMSCVLRLSVEMRLGADFCWFSGLVCGLLFGVGVKEPRTWWVSELEGVYLRLRVRCHPPRHQLRSTVYWRVSLLESSPEAGMGSNRLRTWQVLCSRIRPMVTQNVMHGQRALGFCVNQKT